MRRQLAFVALLPLLLVGCGGRTQSVTGGKAPADSTPAPTVAAAPTSTPVTGPPKHPTPSTANVTNVSKAIPSGSRDSRWGTQYAFLRSSKLSTRQLTYDLIEWFDGKQAVKACAEDGAKPAENDYCEGWYIRNNNKRLRTLTVDPDAPIRLSGAADNKSVDLGTFLSQVGNGNVIRFDIDANRIVKLEHVYLP